MKKLLFAILGAVLLFNFAQPVSAQDYQPFRKGITYHYTAHDSIFSLRVDSVKVLAGDSVFVFNRTYKKIIPFTRPGCSEGHFNPEHIINNNNQFGHQMVKQATGDYKFKSDQGQEFLLKTKVATGQSWTFYQPYGLNITLTSKGIESVLNVLDSVFTYTTSNNHIIKLSKNYGLIKVPNFIAFADPAFSLKTLDLYSLPEKQLGTDISNPFTIFDFQVGDEFRTFNVYQKYGYPTPCNITWTKKKILSKTITSSSDTVIYQIETQRLTKIFGRMACPFPTSTTLSPVGIETLVVTSNYAPEVKTLSKSFFISTSPPITQMGVRNSKINLGITNSKYHQRKKIDFHDTFYRPCLNTLEERLDVDLNNSYGVGLGQIRSFDGRWDGFVLEELECYTKGSENYGNCLTFAQILATQKELYKLPLVQAYPNPFSSELTLTFGQTFGTMNLTLRNNLGQIVWKQEIIGAPNSELKVAMPELAKGLYILQATNSGKTFTTRLVKE